MKIKTIALFTVTFLTISCDIKDEYIITEGGRIEAIELEEQLNSELLESNPLGALPWNFLPTDSQFVFTNPVKYQRTKFESLPVRMRAYEDSLGNEILIYEWDLVTNDMSIEHKKKLQLSFDEHHSLYVSKYNQLFQEISEKLGPAEIVGANIEKIEMEVYKKWSTKSLWKNEKQIVELHLLLAPQEIYRIILKNLIYKHE